MKIFDLQMTGQEPVLVGMVLDDAKFGDALNWYNYYHEASTARKYLVEWSKKTKTNPETDFSWLKDHEVNSTCAAMARMMTNGSIFDSETMARFCQRWETMVELNDRRKTETATSGKKELSVVEKVRNYAGAISARIDAEVFDKKNWGWSFAEFCKTEKLSNSVINVLLEIYKPLYEESLELIEGKDSQLTEAFSHLTRKERLARHAFLETFVEEVSKLAGIKKSIHRKKRKTVQKLPRVLVKNLSYLPSFDELKLKSIAPENIIGAAQLWTYDTKDRELTCYTAELGKTLSVKGTTILNWDIDTSQRRMLRKPPEILPRVIEGGKIILRRIWDDLTTKSMKLNGRVNANTILVKVIK